MLGCRLCARGHDCVQEVFVAVGFRSTAWMSNTPKGLYGSLWLVDAISKLMSLHRYHRSSVWQLGQVAMRFSDCHLQAKGLQGMNGPAIAQFPTAIFH